MNSFRASFGDHEEAWQKFLQAYDHQMNGRLDDAAAAYRASIELHPTAEAWTFLGWTWSFVGRYDLAIDFCKKAIDVDPDFGNPYNDIGSYLIHLGKPEEAIPWLDKALRAPRYESYHFPYVNMGQAWETLGQERKAIEAYSRALAIEPDHDLARVRLMQLVGQLN